MKEEAVALGEQLIVLEENLDAGFASASVSVPDLELTLREIGIVLGQLRGAHLKAHLAMRETLSSDQIARYDELRGYGTGGTNRHQVHGGHRQGEGHPGGGP